MLSIPIRPALRAHTEIGPAESVGVRFDVMPARGVGLLGAVVLHAVITTDAAEREAVEDVGEGWGFGFHVRGLMGVG